MTDFSGLCHRLAAAVPWAAAMLLAGCATVDMPPAVADIPSQAPVRWYAPQPHNGQLPDLTRWWQQWNDPLLVELMEAAQKVSPTVSAARSQIEQARSTRAQAAAALLPEVGISASASRAVARPGVAPSTTWQSAFSLGSPLQPYWELDLFGGNRATRDAAQERLEGAQAQWHDARVAVAAEVASQYLGWRTCEMQALVVTQDGRSRNASARMTQITANAGFQSPSNAALAQASAAEGRSNLANQRAQCDLTVKALVALTGLPEPALREKLAPVALPAGLTPDASGALALTSATVIALQLPQPASLAVQTLPAQVLSQRPDVFNAEREVMAARSEIWATDMAKQPQITLAGSIGVIDVLTRGVTNGANTWSVGPLQINIPIWDWGKHEAALVAAQARYDDAVSAYLGRVRNAVKEVEQALVNLQSAGARNDDAITAATGYLAAVQAAQARYQAGLGSLASGPAGRAGPAGPATGARQCLDRAVPRRRRRLAKARPCDRRRPHPTLNTRALP